VPRGRYQRQPAKDRAVELDLPWQTSQVIAIGLDLVPLEIVSNGRKIDAACTMSDAHLGNEAQGRRLAPYLADQ